MNTTATLQTATFAGGCFWCTEAIYKRLKGIQSVISGYSGGNVENPTYQQVSSGKTGHTESIQIQFDPSLISYQSLLDVFFKIHDPTTPNQQGADHGPQYRSVIFYHNQEQKDQSLNKIKSLTDLKEFENPIITEIQPFQNFYPAEDYHQNFYEQNKNYPYCKAVIDPKIVKLFKLFPEKINNL